MTIKDIASQAGVSHQAIYKRLKIRGVKLESLKDKETGELTEEGMALIRAIFALKDDGGESVSYSTSAEEETQKQATGDSTAALRNQVAELSNQVAELNKEVEKLRNQVSTLEEKEKVLIDERDFLRITLERSQQLQAITMTKVPNPPHALPSGETEKKKGLRAWWQRRRHRDSEENGPV